jgi:hypothetical protein
MNQLEIRFGTINRAEIFTRSVSLQDHSSLKISAQTDHPKWEIVSEGGSSLIYSDWTIFLNDENAFTYLNYKDGVNFIYFFNYFYLLFISE